MRLVFKTAIIGLAVVLTGCATISEQDCQIGAWAEYGYKDGMNGRSGDRIADYAERCGKFGIKPDMTAYLSAHKRGVAQYCTYERGYDHGEEGRSFNKVCTGEMSADYVPGYDAGRARYEIKQGRERLVDSYDQVVADIAEVERRLSVEELEDGERRRLDKKLRRLNSRCARLEDEIRDYEYQHDLPPHPL